MRRKHLRAKIRSALFSPLTTLHCSPLVVSLALALRVLENTCFLLMRTGDTALDLRQIHLACLDSMDEMLRLLEELTKIHLKNEVNIVARR